MRPAMLCLVLSYGVDENELLYKNLIAQEEAAATATIALVPRFMLDSYDFLEEHLNRYATCCLRIVRSWSFCMEFKSLLISQANEMFIILAEKGFNMSDFEWTDTTSSWSGTHVSKLVHKPSKFYFIIDNTRSGKFCSEYSPSDQDIRQLSENTTYDNQRVHFRKWAEYLAREVNSPNLWAEMPSDTKLIETAVGDELNTKFTKEEQEVIVSGLEEIKQYLLTAHKLDPELIEGQIKYLVDSANRLGRKDWKNALIGALFGIILQAGVGSHAAQEIFQFVWTVLSAVLIQKLYLP